MLNWPPPLTPACLVGLLRHVYVRDNATRSLGSVVSRVTSRMGQAAPVGRSYVRGTASHSQLRPTLFWI